MAASALRATSKLKSTSFPCGTSMTLIAQSQEAYSVCRGAVDGEPHHHGGAVKHERHAVATQRICMPVSTFADGGRFARPSTESAVVNAAATVGNMFAGSLISPLRHRRVGGLPVGSPLAHFLSRWRFLNTSLGDAWSSIFAQKRLAVEVRFPIFSRPDAR